MVEGARSPQLGAVGPGNSLSIMLITVSNLCRSSGLGNIGAGPLGLRTDCKL